MNTYVIGFQQTDKTKLSLAGGKGANLGALYHIKDIHVPDGFCITTNAFEKIIDEASVGGLLGRLTSLEVTDTDAIRSLSAAIRYAIETTTIPKDIHADILRFLAGAGPDQAWAIRSSATAEDLPAASFAGQQDSYLNIIGEKAILEHISKCWASLFTERAVIYRIQNGFGHLKVHLAVIVQQMVFPQVSGIIFTADPVNGNRKVVSIDAGFGLGEALVSGIVNADHYKVRERKIIDKKIAVKERAIYPLKDGGTEQVILVPEMQRSQTLTDEQLLQLERIGRKIETHFGRPQDIEWCLADDRFYMLQSRPITTLFPVPETNDNENHLYISVGHQQMMTDAMKPLGISFWQHTAARPMHTAGGRLFVDIAQQLATTAGRTLMIDVLGKSDPLIKGALTSIIERGDFIPPLADTAPQTDTSKHKGTSSNVDFQTLKDYDPAIVTDMIQSMEASVARLKQNIAGKSGAELVDFILEDIEQLKKGLTDPQSFGVIMTSMNAATWINENMEAWLGEKRAADVLAQSVPNNVTSEMGLALLDIADVIRPHHEVVAYLQQVKDDDFISKLDQLDGGRESRYALEAFLDKYGMRCAGEIDITRTRWSEKPLMLLPLLLSNIRNLEPGESKRRFEQGLQEAMRKEQDLLERLNRLPDGAQKAAATKRMTGLLRNLAGYREYPKYDKVSRYFVYKQALMQEATRLVQAHVIPEEEAIFYLTLEELQEVVREHKLDKEIVSQRKEAYHLYEKLSPPRVMTSEGEVITGKYTHEDLPDGAIAGLAVSSGIIEGRARVLLNMQDANLETGDILVTAFTDPSWTPLFVAIKGLVTEVGGLMTHGAVIAREYGLPAVVGVEHATERIRDGQRIRVNGTDGYIELL